MVMVFVARISSPNIRYTSTVSLFLSAVKTPSLVIVAFFSLSTAQYTPSGSSASLPVALTPFAVRLTTEFSVA